MDAAQGQVLSFAAAGQALFLFAVFAVFGNPLMRSDSFDYIGACASRMSTGDNRIFADFINTLSISAD